MSHPVALARELKALGFQNVRVGGRGSTLVVEYENGRFNHNEIDGLGLVLGTTLARAPQAFESFLLSIRKQDVRVLEVEGPIEPFRRFFQGWEPPEAVLIQSLGVRRAESLGSPGGVTWSGEEPNSSWFHSRLILGPGLQTTIGTEVGAFNYRLSLRPDLQVSLWPGAVANFLWDIPVSWSSTYASGQPFGARGTAYSMERAWFAQAIPLGPGLMAQVGGGRYFEGQAGAMGDLMWASSTGQHRLWLKAAQFREADQPDQRVLLGAYRAYFQPLEAYIEGVAGRFYNNDKGYRVELKRYFDDVSLSIWYSRTDYQKLGFTFGLPLTPRRDMTPGWIQMRGSERWQYDMSSTVHEPSRGNYLRPNQAIVPATTFNLERSFYNNDRLNETYLSGQLERLREAYRMFRPLPPP
jgi:hypothetical protein